MILFEGNFLICRFYWIYVRKSNTFYGKQEDIYLQNIFSVKTRFWWKHFTVTSYPAKFLFLIVFKCCWFISATVSCEKKEKIGRMVRGALIIKFYLFSLFHFTGNLINAFLLSKTSWRTSAEPYTGLTQALIWLHKSSRLRIANTSFSQQIT